MRSISPAALAGSALLAAVAGYVDAIGFILSGGLFVSFMSGNSTQAGVESIAGHPMTAVVAGVIVLCFVLGVTVHVTGYDTCPTCHGSGYQPTPRLRTTLATELPHLPPAAGGPPLHRADHHAPGRRCEQNDATEPPSRRLRGSPPAGSDGAAVRRNRGTDRAVRLANRATTCCAITRADRWPGELANKLLDNSEVARQ